MKKLLVVFFAMMVAVAFAATGFAQGPGPEKMEKEQMKADKKMDREEMKADKKMEKKHKKLIKKKHKRMEKEMKKEGPPHEPGRE